jgi:hypothetical protein
MSVEESKPRVFMFRDGHLSVKYFDEATKCQIYSVSDTNSNQTVSDIKYTSEQISKMSEIDLVPQSMNQSVQSVSHINLVQQQTEIDSQLSLIGNKPVQNLSIAYNPGISQSKPNEAITASGAESKSLTFNKYL